MSQLRYYIPTRSSSTGIPRRGGFIELCSTDSARGRFRDEDAADVDLTEEGVSVLVACVVSLVKGFSEDEAVVGAGLILIFVFAGSTDEGVATDVGVEASLPFSVLSSSGFGFVPDSNSMRRLRIFTVLG